MFGYEFNVSEKGLHLFCTATRYVSAEEALRLFTLLQERFPAGEGFSVVAIRWANEGQQLTEAEQFT